MSIKYSIFDIDGTLANVEHRLHYINKPKDSGKREWGKFFAAAKDDEPIQYVLDMYRHLVSVGDIYLLTGRPESERKKTEEWLAKHNIVYKGLFMRPNGDHRPDFESKKDLFLANFGDRKEDCIAIFEDRLHVCKAWVELGLPLFVCGKDWMHGDWSK